VSEVISRTLHGLVVAALGRDIVEGAYRPGDALPIETALCVRFKVSRGIVREAVKSLAAKGLVETRPKTGTRVRAKRDWHLLDPALLEWWSQSGPRFELLTELNDVRRCIEPGVAELAAQRSTPQDLAELTRAYHEMERTIRDGEAFIEADLAFHATLLRCSQSLLLEQLHRPIDAALRLSFATTSTVPGATAATMPLHLAVLNTIRLHDACGASAAMRRLIDLSQEHAAFAAALDTRAHEESA
jgi:DNA-binding FadR family transcriptional regulator